MTNIAESLDCHRGLVRGCVTQMVKYTARGTAFASSSLRLSFQLNRRFQVELNVDVVFLRSKPT